MIRKLQEGERERKTVAQNKRRIRRFIDCKDVVDFVTGISELHRSYPM